MKILSEVFLVTYSILYGIMLNSSMGLSLFPFGRLSMSITALKRILVSLTCINIAPFVVFSLVLYHLEANTENITPSIDSLFGVFLLSTIMFVFYRLIQVIIAWNYKWLYDFDKEKFDEHGHNQKERVLFVADSSKEGHIFSVFLYIVLFAIGWIMVYKTYPI